MQNAMSLIDQYDSFILDYDGVLENVYGPIAGSTQFLTEILKRKKQYCIMSNMSYSKRAEFLKHFIKVQKVDLPIEHLFLASYIASLYIIDHPEFKSVFVIGNQAIQEELENKGITVYGGLYDNENRLLPETPQTNPFHKADAVLVGYDSHLNMHKVYGAYYALQNGAKLFATNLDPVYKAIGKIMPDTGSWVTGLKEVSGVEPMILGKPSKLAFDVILKHMKFDPKRTVMIGDSLATDILGANDSGIDSCLMLGGVSSKEDIERLKIHPKYIISQLIS